MRTGSGNLDQAGAATDLVYTGSCHGNGRVHPVGANVTIAPSLAPSLALEFDSPRPWLTGRLQVARTLPAGLSLWAPLFCDSACNRYFDDSDDDDQASITLGSADIVLNSPKVMHVRGRLLLGGAIRHYIYDFHTPTFPPERGPTPSQTVVALHYGVGLAVAVKRIEIIVEGSRYDGSVERQLGATRTDARLEDLQLGLGVRLGIK
jgi:hypothetical protein